MDDQRGVIWTVRIILFVIFAPIISFLGYALWLDISRWN